MNNNIIKGAAPHHRRIVIKTDKIKNIKRILLSAHRKFLTLSENIGISETKSQENRMIKTMMKTTLPQRAATFSERQFNIGLEVADMSAKEISEAMNIELAGVGNPIKEDVCLSSILNLAKRRAEKTEIKKAI